MPELGGTELGGVELGGQSSSQQTAPPSPPTQTSVALIRHTIQNAQPISAKIQGRQLPGSSAKARIQNRTLRTLIAVSRLVKTVLKINTAAARIRLRSTITQSTVGRVRRTMPAVITVKGRMVNFVQKTLQSRGRVRKTATQIQTSISRTRKSATTDLSALSRIERIRTMPILTLARIIVAGVGIESLDAVARITNNALSTIFGISRIQRIVPNTQSMRARLRSTLSQDLASIAAIGTFIRQHITSAARMDQIRQPVLQSKSRLQRTVAKEATAAGELSLALSFLQSAIASVQRSFQIQISAKGAVGGVTQVSLNAVANIGPIERSIATEFGFEQIAVSTDFQIQ